jgi:hypothetical protein
MSACRADRLREAGDRDHRIPHAGHHPADVLERLWDPVRRQRVRRDQSAGPEARDLESLMYVTAAAFAAYFVWGAA